MWDDPDDGGVPGGGDIAGGFDPLPEPEGALGTAMFAAGVGDLLRSFFTSCLMNTRRFVFRLTFLPLEFTAFFQSFVSILP